MDIILPVIFIILTFATVIIFGYYFIDEKHYWKRIIKQNETINPYNDTTVYDDDITLPVVPNLKIIGTPAFIMSTYQVLDELHEKAPVRYEEAVSNLAQYTQTCKTLADGSDYEAFRCQFLQSLARCVCLQRDSNCSEKSVNDYVREVLSELM